MNILMCSAVHVLSELSILHKADETWCAGRSTIIHNRFLFAT